MRLQDVTGNVKGIDSEDERAELVAVKIIEMCKPFLKMLRGLPLYRGMAVIDHERDDGAAIKTTRTKRRPRDSDQVDHDYMNQLIEEAGKEANRSNSIFCTGSWEDANGYAEESNGRVCVVFPIGNFNYTWSTRYADMGYDAGYDIEDPNSITELKRSFRGDDDTLQQAIDSHHEVMIKCDKAIYVTASYKAVFDHLRKRGVRLNVEDYTEPLQ